MIKYLAIIPARQNSKRIKRKNLVKIKNKKMFYYTLDAAKKTKEIKKIVTTTDIKELLKKNTKRLIHIKRPKQLTKDHCSTESAIFHVIKYIKHMMKLEIENIIILQPTSPFRNSKDIKAAIRFFEKGKYDSLFSAFEDKMSIWKYKNKNYNPITYNLKKRKREQDSKSLIIENGAIYIFSIKKFLLHKVRLFGKIGCFLMNKKSSIEIDDDFDLHLAKNI